MRKTISNGINRRAVYKFTCSHCQVNKTTYVYERAKKAVCLSCEKTNQEGVMGLFDMPVIDLGERGRFENDGETLRGYNSNGDLTVVIGRLTDEDIVLGEPGYQKTPDDLKKVGNNG